MVLLLLDTKYPKIFPARFARRIASFPYSFACFGCKIPQKFPGALRAPDGFISLWFCLFRNPNTPKFPRRASRAGLPHFPIFLHVLDPKYLIFPGALRAPDCFSFLCFCCFWSPNTAKNPRRASRAGLLKEIIKGILTGLLRH